MYYHIEGVKFMNPSLKIEIESSRAVWGEEAHETMTKLEKPRPDASVQSKPKDEVIPSSKKAYDMIYNLLNYEDRTGDDLIDSLIRDGIGKTTASNARTRLKTEGLIIDYKLDGKYWWKLVSRHELECQDPTQDPTPKGVVKSLDPGSKDKTDDIHTVGHYIYNKVAKGHVLNYQDPGSNAHMTPQMLDPELDPGKSDRKVLKDGGSMTHDIRRAKLLKQYSPGLMGYSIKDIMSVTLDCELDRLSDPEMFELHVIEVAKLL